MGRHAITIAFSIVICFLLAIPYSVAAATISKAPNNLGLVGYWSFNEGSGTVARDYSGAGNQGTLTNSPTWTSGKLGKALNFNGSSNYVALPSGASLKSKCAATISGWYKPQANPSNNASVYYESTSASGYTRFGVFHFTNGDLATYMRDTNSGSSFSATEVGGASNNFGKWIHVVATVDSVTDNLILYRDGIQVAIDNTAKGCFTSDNPVSTIAIGAFTPNLFSVNGSIDDVRVYSRALSASEVYALYNSGAAKVGSSATLTQGTTLANGLVAQYSLDGADVTDKVYDRAGGNNGYFIGAATSSAKVAGKLGQAMSFNGTSSYVNIGNAIFSTTDGTQPYSASVWIKTSTGDGILTQYDVASGVRFGLRAESGKLKYWKGSDKAVSSASVNDNKWHHVVFTKTAAGTIQLYVDGVADGSGTDTSAYSNTNTRIGTFSPTDAFFAGLIDDVQIYNRALTAAEVKQLYQLGGAKLQASATTLTQGTTLASGLVGHWTFDGADFTDKVYDRSGQGNNGYLYNAASSSVKTIGKLGQGIRFDGVDDDILVTDSSSLNIGTNDFTLAAWVKGRAMANSDAIFLKTNGGGASSSYGFHFGVFDSLIPTVHFATGAVAHTKIQGSTSLVDGRWYHVVVSVNRSDMTQTKVYVNGVADSTTVTNGSTNTGSISNTVPLAIGSESDNGFNWDGSLDDVRMYSRALSAAEVLQLYRLGK